MERIDKERISNIARRYNLRLVILFGSRASGSYTADSDYDIGVWFEDYSVVRQGDTRLYRSLFEQFTEALGSRKVHLAILNRATPLLLWEAAKGQLLYERKPGDWTEFRVQAAKKHWDNRLFYEAERRYLEERYGGM